MKAKYIGCSKDQVRWGSNDDPNGILEIGETYEISNIDIRSMHTKITLTDFPDMVFNSVCFEVSNYD